MRQAGTTSCNHPGLPVGTFKSRHLSFAPKDNIDHDILFAYYLGRTAARAGDFPAGPGTKEF